MILIALCNARTLRQRAATHPGAASQGSVLAPARNEEAGSRDASPRSWRRLSDFEVLFLDDESTDAQGDSRGAGGLRRALGVLSGGHQRQLVGMALGCAQSPPRPRASCSTSRMRIPATNPRRCAQPCPRWRASTPTC